MAKIFLGHQTTKGRVVYRRKKHTFNLHDMARVTEKVLFAYFPSDDPDYVNHMAPVKFVLDLARQRYQEAQQRYFTEHPEHMETVYQNFTIARARIDPDAEWNRIYNLFIDVLNKVKQVSGYLGWIPFVGNMLSLIGDLWEGLRQALHIEKRFVSTVSKKEQKKNKP